MEIKKDLSLTNEQNSLLVMHSILNIFNVIIYNLMRLDNAYGNYEIIEDLQDRVVETSARLSNEQEAFRVIEEIDTFRAFIDQGLEHFLLELRQKEESEATYWEVNETLLSVYNILGLRSRELISRKESSDSWASFSDEELRNDLVNTFHAVEQNGYGAYRIVFKAEDHDQEAYLVKVLITPSKDNHVRMPRVFQDIIRDLIANSRKYSPPGATIVTKIEDSGTELRLTVKDSGVGIEPSEIEQLVDFGMRGSNVSHRPTRGGGFGLTKAYFFTKAFKGRFWIESEPGEGTLVKIEIPQG